MIQSTRIRLWRDAPPRRGRYVLYWMQQSQRAVDNHALEYAVREAQSLDLPVVVAFALTAYPEANLRHYTFLLEGLFETRAQLQERGMAFALRRAPPAAAIPQLAADAALLVMDRGYLRPQQEWRREVVDALAGQRVVEVESDVVVPVDAVSAKEEFAARTIRPKLTRLMPGYLCALETIPVRRRADHLKLPGTEPWTVVDLLRELRPDDAAGPSPVFHGGFDAARRRLDEFVRQRLASFAGTRNDPAREIASHLSPYLHFGQIAPLTVARAVQASGAPADAIAAYLEELVVRRELSMNFVARNPRYDRYDALPAWARQTLARHARDPRPERYTPAQLEAGATRDPYWNAAQREMRITGRMPNYLRMYWGKKVLEWSRSPAAAFELLLTLNNRYELDGRDANSFAGIAWCFGKHDRPWGERPIFGTVRYMNAAGLKRKFDMDAYLERIAALAGSAGRA